MHKCQYLTALTYPSRGVVGIRSTHFPPYFSGLVTGQRWWAGSGLGRAGPALVGRPITFSYDGPRPGSAHHFFIWWAAARPGSSNFEMMGRGPARRITFSIVHGPARQFFKILSPTRPITSLIGPARSTGPGQSPGRRWWAGPELGRAGPACPARPINF